MKEESVYIEIRDNGCGLEKEKLKKLVKLINQPITNSDQEGAELVMALDDRETSNHVGLRNINLRLKMYYGKNYGLRIESTKDVGTTVLVRINKGKEDGKAVTGGR